MTSYRVATEADVDDLAQMRWDFRQEEAPGATVHDQASFLEACTAATYAVQTLFFSALLDA